LNRPVAEIGVHHGKFFIGLVKTKGALTGNFAIDVFDMQELNLDHSGKGSMQRFEHNLAECGVPRESVEIVCGDSLALGDEDLRRIERTAGAFSFFSVDGCHLAEHTNNDVRIAMRLTAPEGIILVDDYHNPSWPGVQEGVAKLYFTDTPRFVPLLYSSAKLFMAHISHHARYLELVADFLETNHPGTTVKRARRFGYDSLTVIPDGKNIEALV
jgi:SAM-dependent methyltransferase